VAAIFAKPLRKSAVVNSNGITVTSSVGFPAAGRMSRALDRKRHQIMAFPLMPDLAATKASPN
jgi:hypothetical protein